MRFTPGDDADRKRLASLSASSDCGTVRETVGDDAVTGGG